MIPVFWDMTLCRQVHSQSGRNLKMEPTGSFEVLAPLPPLTQLHNPED